MARNPNVRFCQNNMLQASGVVLTASGAKSGFPVSNLADPARYKQWVTPGTFVITTSNQAVPINDGANKSGTVPVGTYTYASLAVAVQTALNVVSTNWTCAYDFALSTFKFTINRTSGTKILRCSVQLNAIWDTLGYVGLVDQVAAAADEQRNHTSEFFTVDLLTARAPLAFLLIAAADTVFPIASIAVITLKANNVNDFSSPAVSRTLTVGDDGIFHWLDDLADTTYRYWKYEFADRKNPLGPEGFKLNIAYLGDYVSPLATNVVVGFGRSLADGAQKVQSISGVNYFKTSTKVWTFESLAIEYLEASERVAVENAVADLGVSTSFFLALDPLQAISASAGELTKYCNFMQKPQIRHVIYKKFTISFAVEEQV